MNIPESGKRCQTLYLTFNVRIADKNYPTAFTWMVSLLCRHNCDDFKIHYSDPFLPINTAA